MGTIFIIIRQSFFNSFSFLPRRCIHGAARDCMHFDEYYYCAQRISISFELRVFLKKEKKQQHSAQHSKTGIAIMIADDQVEVEMTGVDVEEARSVSPSSPRNSLSEKSSSRRSHSSSMYWNQSSVNKTVLPRFEMYVRTLERRRSEGKPRRRTINQLFEPNIHGIDDSLLDDPDCYSSSDKSRTKLDDHGKDEEAGIQVEKPADTGKKKIAAKEAVKFGMFEGVFARCLLNIWGVIMFLRIGWMVAHGGAWQSTSIVVAAMTVTVITTLSLSAICTNGIVGSGGAYYLLSRSLGPEFGGAIGVLFSLANATAVALHLIGFAETIVGVFPDDTTLIGDGSWDLRIIAIACLIFLICIALVGVAWVVKFQLVLLVLLVASIIAYFIGTFSHTPVPDVPIGYTGYNSTTLDSNLKSDWDLSKMTAPMEIANIATESWVTLFAVFFPASTGIMAGANISGDLKDAQRAIPVGTLAAVVVSGVIYLLIIWSLAATTDSYALAGCINMNASDTCDGGDGDADKNLNFLVMMDISVWPPLIVIGIVASSLSSALAALVGAPRVFQALCKDNLFPAFAPFAKGVGPSEEPIRAYGLTFIIAVGVMMIGELNFIAPYVTNFFMISYALINYACFASSLAKTPGWRPTFKYYSPPVALVGVFLCCGAMFMIDWLVALITFTVCGCLYGYIRHAEPDVNWGPVSQGRAYKKAVQNVMKLEMLKDLHLKNFRPSYLVMDSRNKTSSQGLIDFVHTLKHGGGISIGAHVIHPVDESAPLDKSVLGLIQSIQNTKSYSTGRNHARMVPEAVTAPSLESGFSRLLQTSGLGRLRPNTVLFGYKDMSDDTSGRDAFVGMLRQAFLYEKGVGILRDYAPGRDELKGSLDVWWTDDDGGLTLLIPFILMKHRVWKGLKLRVFVPRDESVDARVQETDLEQLFYRLRIKAEVHVTSMHSLNSSALERAYKKFSDFLGDGIERNLHLQMKRKIALGLAIASLSDEAKLVVCSLPFPEIDIPSKTYAAFLRALADPLHKSKVPILLLRGFQQRLLTMNM